MYGQRKAIAKRIPLYLAKTRSQQAPLANTLGSTDNTHHADADIEFVDPSSTPSATEGDTATETDIETETEMDGQNTISQGGNLAKFRLSKHQTQLSAGNSVSMNSSSPSPRKKTTSQHDLLHKYFRRDTVVLKNVDLLR